MIGLSIVMIIKTNVSHRRNNTSYIIDDIPFDRCYDNILGCMLVLMNSNTFVSYHVIQYHRSYGVGDHLSLSLSIDVILCTDIVVVDVVVITFADNGSFVAHVTQMHVDISPCLLVTTW